MRRAILPITLTLALITGFALAETRLVVLAPAVALDGEPQLTPNADLIRQFYAAVNTVLGTGDVEPLDRFVGRDLVEHTSRPGVSPDRDGLLRYLQALHATEPSLQLTVLDLLAQGDRVAARVRLDGGDDATFLGLPIAVNQIWSAFDVFRIESNRIVEHWADEAGLAFFDPLVRVAVPVGNPTRKAVTLERWTYAPNAVASVSTYLGFAVFLVESGTLTVELDTRSVAPARLVPRIERVDTGDEVIMPGSTVRLTAGDTLVVPDGNLFELRNGELTPMVALAVMAIAPTPTTGPGSGTGMGSQPNPVGVTRTGLAGGLTANLPRGQTVIAIGRATLASWAILPAHPVGVAELIAVESGELTLTASGGAAWARPSPTDGTRKTESASLPAGGGALINPDSTVFYRNAGPSSLGVVLVTFSPLAVDQATAEATPSQ